MAKKDITKKERQTLEEGYSLLFKQLIHQNYAEYLVYVNDGRWILGKHLDLLCRKVEDLIYRRMKQKILIVSMPPQHGKSQCITESLPSYYLGKFPIRRVIEVSYGDDLARGFGRRNREKIERHGATFFGIELAKGSRSDTEFELSNGIGGMISRGIMAGVTGKPADLIIIDDPIKNRQEADSEVYRNRIWDEFLNSIYTRLSANGVIIVIMTRWHEDDLAGRLLDPKNGLSDKCLELNIPLEAEEDDILGRSIGDALFPEIGKDNAWLMDFKSAYISKEGSRTWNALMQGRPTSMEGNIFKRNWWQWYKQDALPEMMQTIISVDATFKGTETSDYVSIQAWGKRKASMYLLDRTKAQMDFPTTLREIKLMHNKYPKTCAILVEDKANGSAIISMLQMEIPYVIGINPDGGKVARANAVSPSVEAGNVYLPEDAEWIHDFVEEASSFPNAKHDDDVDSMTQALNRFIYYSADLPDEVKKPDVVWEEDKWEEYYRADEDTKLKIIAKFGNPF